MILKLINDDSAISISRWEYGLDDDVDAWNEDLFTQHRKGLPGTDCILAEKIELQLKNEKLRAIKTYTNLEENGVKVGIISYSVIKNGDFFIVGYIQPKELTKQSSSEIVEKIIMGLTIKEKKSLSGKYTVADFESFWLENFKKTNKTLPMKVDDATTLYGITVVGKMVLLKYYVEPEFVGYLDSEWAARYKEKTISNMFLSVPNAEYYTSYFAESSIVMKYLFYDREDNLIRTLQITPKDFKR